MKTSKQQKTVLAYSLMASPITMYFLWYSQNWKQIACSVLVLALAVSITCALSYLFNKPITTVTKVTKAGPDIKNSDNLCPWTDLHR